MEEIHCADRKCRWNRKGKCVLFRGQSILECKYRLIPKPSTTTTKKKGK